MRVKVIGLLVCLFFASFLTAFPQDGDGKFHDPYDYDKIQPAMCNNQEKNTHACDCERATKCNGGGPNKSQEPGKLCQTRCRPNACDCVTPGCS